MNIHVESSSGSGQVGERREHPVVDLQPFALPSSFWQAENPCDAVALQHVPFSFWVIEALRPRVVVASGTGGACATTYLSFCQAVARLCLPSRCFWFMGPSADVNDDLSSQGSDGPLKRNGVSYAEFSRMLDVAVAGCGPFLREGTVDVLSIDGLSSADDPRKVVEQVRPYLSERAVALVSGIDKPEAPDVSRGYSMLAEAHPSFEFNHGAGLGLLSLGEVKPPLLESLLEAAERKHDYAAVRGMFSRLGQGCQSSYQLQEAQKKIRWLYQVRKKLTGEIAQKEELVGEMRSEVHEARSGLASVKALLREFEQAGD